METYIGVVTHYFNHLGVAVLSLTGELSTGSVIHIQGHQTDFYQDAWSIEINHAQVETGKPGQEVALKVIAVVRTGDKIYLAPEAQPTRPEDLQEQYPDIWER